MREAHLAVGLIWIANALVAQDADLTIFVDGPLLEHGGAVEVTAVPASDISSDPQTITLSDRYARVQLRYPEGASYNYRFRPVPEAMEQDGMERFATEALSVGSRTVDGPNGPQDADWRSIRVQPFAEYGGADPAERTSAAWGETQAFADPPPANHWGARSLRWVFDTFGNRRTVGLICKDNAAVSICTPDPEDALLMEALWWRSIAEGRLERLRHNSLQECYDSGGFLSRPKRCEGEPGRGWPTYLPVD
ncbi:MAG: hypothetical protein AAGG57_14105 [Pseudomonadota bacterium]